MTESSLSPRFELAFARQHERAQQDVADDVAALVDSQQTVEQVDGGSSAVVRLRDGALACLLPQRRRHVVEHGALLAQLLVATQTATAVGDGDLGRSSPRSKPSARIDAIAAMERVDVESRWWADALGTRSRTRLPDRLRGLVGGAGHSLGLTDERGRTLAKATRSWVSLARVVTGHDSPPFSPHVRCPDCDRLGGLRVRLSSRVAVCLECGQSWEDDATGSLQRLAVWVGWATEHLAGPAHLVPDDAEVGVDQRPCVECAVERAAFADRQRARRRCVTPV